MDQKGSNLKRALKDIDKSETKEDLLSILKEMVSIPTEAPSGKHYNKFVNYAEVMIKDRLPHFYIERVNVPEEVYDKYPHLIEKFEGPRVNLLIKAPYKKETRVHINGHYDVVVPGDLKKWTITKPYEPKVKDGRLYGRGTADMKGNIACLIKALEIIQKYNLSPHFSMDISLTCDEEYGEYTGLLYLVDETLKGKRYIVGDTLLSLDGDIEKLDIGASGFIAYLVTTKGRSVHSSRAYTGVNAIVSMLYVLQSLHELSLRVETKWSKFDTFSRYGLPKAKPCLNITLIRGGHSINAIPEKCTVEGDRRVIPDEDYEEAGREIVNVILDVKRRYNLDLEFEIHFEHPPYVTQPENKVLQIYKKCAESVLKGEVQTIVGMGSTDISHVRSRLNMNVFAHGAGDTKSNSHGWNESVGVENLLNLTKILVKFLTKDSK